MISSIKKIEKNLNISNDMRKFFLEFGINIDEIFEETDLQEIFKESVSDGDIRQMVNMIKSVENSNNSHKLLFAAGLLEIRSQIKKNQEQTADTKRQIERRFKDIAIIIETGKRENHQEFNSLASKIDNIDRLITSRFK